MSNRIIMSPDEGTFEFSAGSFRDAAKRQWGSDVRVADREPDQVVATVLRPGETQFSVRRFDGNFLSLDGTPEQDTEVANWVRSNADRVEGRLWLIDWGMTGHCDVLDPANFEDMWAGWVEHEQGEAVPKV